MPPRLKNRNAKLTEAHVIAIRASNVPVTHLAVAFGVDVKTIRQIRQPNKVGSPSVM
jgi:hypothetical protein